MPLLATHLSAFLAMLSTCLLAATGAIVSLVITLKNHRASRATKVNAALMGCMVLIVSGALVLDAVGLSYGAPVERIVFLPALVLSCIAILPIGAVAIRFVTAYTRQT